MLKLFVVLIVYLFILPTLASAQSGVQLRSTVDLIVIHTIGGPSCQNSSVAYPTIAGDAKRWLTYFEDHENIGIHYVIGRAGEMLAGIRENEIAYHAYGNNQTSIGIELVNNGDGSDPFPPEQISALVKLLRELCSRYGLSVDKIKGHEDIDKRMFQCGSSLFKEKVDPGLAFPWHGVREALSPLSLPGSPIVTKGTGLD
jgi:N-acetylmuramoyl-L-alanine amidase